MKNGNYFSALKIIQLIRHEHLSAIRQFHFANIILSKFQNYKSQIAAQSTKEFTLYLESVQLNTARVGGSILRRYTQREERQFGCLPVTGFSFSFLMSSKDKKLRNSFGGVLYFRSFQSYSMVLYNILESAFFWSLTVVNIISKCYISKEL